MRENVGNKVRSFFVAVVLCLGLVAVSAQADVRICRSGGYDIYADHSGTYPVSSAFQTCVDDPTVAAINLEPGTYLVDAPIVARRPLTIRTAGLALETRNCQQLGSARCATLIASASNSACINNPAFCGYNKPSSGGMLQARNASRVIFDHLILDGNRANRQHTQARSNCGAVSNRYGFNASMGGCGGTSSGERCEFTYNYTRNALCGTGLEFSGDYARIQGNAANDNGTQAARADGLTIIRNNNGIVNDNHLVNNTGVALGLGAGRNTQIQSNWIQQNGVFAHAALMLGNFAEAGAAQSGDYTNASVRYNTIQCYSYWCGIGISLGGDPWSDDDLPNIQGGLVTQNNVNGARVLINFGGAGTAYNRITVTNNTLSGAPTYSMPIAPGSSCYVTPNVLQNLPNNNTAGLCGNSANADPIATSANCFKNCF